MAERRPIFSSKRGQAQIGYIERNGAFDRAGRRCCDYDTTTGNLSNPETGKIVGHVSLAGFFVGASWMAAELFGSNEDRLADLERLAKTGAPPPPGGSDIVGSAACAAVVGTAASHESADDGPVERAIEMVWSVLNKAPR